MTKANARTAAQCEVDRTGKSYRVVYLRCKPECFTFCQADYKALLTDSRFVTDIIIEVGKR